MCPTRSSNGITDAHGGHRLLTSETSDASGVAGSQLRCPGPRPSGKDMGARTVPVAFSEARFQVKKSACFWRHGRYQE